MHALFASVFSVMILGNDRARPGVVVFFCSAVALVIGRLAGRRFLRQSLGRNLLWCVGR